MRALVLVVTLLAALLAPTQHLRAQEPEPPTEEPEAPLGPPAIPEAIIQPGKLERFSRVIFVLDVSGSMTSDRLTRAASVTRVFASDGFHAACITFSDSFSEWKGAPSHEHAESDECSPKCVPVGWAEMPANQKALNDHLVAIEKGGNTHPGAALIRAIERALPGTLIVFVSDGEFDGDAVVDAIDRGQAARKKRVGEAPEIPILSWTVVPAATDAMMLVGKRGGGGLWREAGTDTDDYPW